MKDGTTQGSHSFSHMSRLLTEFGMWCFGCTMLNPQSAEALQFAVKIQEIIACMGRSSTGHNPKGTWLGEGSGLMEIES